MLIAVTAISIIIVTVTVNILLYSLGLSSNLFDEIVFITLFLAIFTLLILLLVFLFKKIWIFLKIISKNKRPVIITTLAVLILLSIPGDILKAIKLNKKTYQDEIKNIESLIRDGEVEYRGKTILWKDQRDFRKKSIIRQLNFKKKILPKFFIYLSFQYLFVVLDLLLFYALWNLKKWTFIVLTINTFFAILFNSIFMFFPLIYFVVLSIIYLALVILLFASYKKYFIY